MKNLNMSRVIGVIVIVAVIGWFIFTGTSKWRVKQTPVLNSNSYYAVFMTNGQVYFGHLSNVADQYISLKNIYYLQLAQSLQSTDSKDTTALKDNSNQELALIKLGKEVHGPKDAMQINRDQVLFYEELNDDSQVVQTINKSK